MRLDYALYGLAIILFALSAITLVYVADVYWGVIYAAVTAVVGILLLGGGYVLRPKLKRTPTVQTTLSTPEPIEDSVQQKSVSTSVAEEISEGTKTDTPIAAEASTVQGSPIVEAPKVEKTVIEASTAIKTQPPIVEKVESVSEDLDAKPQSVSEKESFSQIRGINQKRAEQLKANGVSNIEELANADPIDLAAKLGLSPKIVKMWIGSAKKIAK